jgi:acid phosphatase
VLTLPSNDNFQTIPANVATIVDILEDKGISWGAYQEDMPYTGYEGFSWVDPEQLNDYVRKHNPFVQYDSISSNKDRLAVIKNLTLFYEDLANDKLPQYMFITPNMTNDGHDTNVTVAGKWSRDFLTPLLSNRNFLQNTLVLLTFDEDATYTDRNTIYAVLLGDALPVGSAGTKDGNYYNHYSQISTMEANWDLHTLGRWDVGANVFSVAVSKSYDECDAPRQWKAPPPFSAVFFNESYPGPLNSVNSGVPWPAPDVDAQKCGRTVLPSVVQAWKGLQQDSYYSDGNTVDVPDGLNLPVYGDEPEGKWYRPRRNAP